jgi:NAD(P)-dependent dehydrogenase (short-subunit alcohol dehydrogenase family)
VERTFSRISTELGPIYGLVNNAGIDGVDKPIHELEEKEWDAVINVNLKGTFFCTKHAIPQMMKAQSGSIVNFSSTWGIVGSKHIPQYHASKGAAGCSRRLARCTTPLTVSG